MSEMGKAMMGTGEAEGDRRALDAAEAAISNPLLDDVSLQGARGILINITGGYDMTLYEVDEAANRIREEVDPEANIIFGSTFDERLNGKIRVSVVATGIGLTQDTLFKGRDIADIVGVNKQEPSHIFDGIPNKAAFMNEEIVEEIANSSAASSITTERKYGSISDMEEREKAKRRSSFFDRFAAKAKQQKPSETSFGDSNLHNGEISQQQQDRTQNAANITNYKNDELEIPACFRRKK
jgi:hypothetical protein